MFWRRRRKPTAQWIVTVTEIRSLGYESEGRDEVAYPERKLGQQALDAQEKAEELAQKLRYDSEVQAGLTRVKVTFLGH